MSGGSSGWVKSSFSNVIECVEVNIGPNEVLVRNSNDRTGPFVAFTHQEWAAFVEGVRNGEFVHRLGGAQ